MSYLTNAASAIRLALFCVVVYIFIFSGPTNICSWGELVTYMPSAISATRKPNFMREDAMILAIQRDGKMYFQTEQVSREQLSWRLADAIQHGAENRVYLKVERQARYATVKIALNEIRSAGVEHITFITQDNGPFNILRQ
jgi:biopolymer transport protein ExbD/biopolymer transport protein TolR